MAKRRDGSTDLWRLQFAMMRMWLSAGEVIWRRSLMMAQGAMTATEAAQMVMEKPAAFADGAQRAAISAARGATAAQMVQAGLAPIARSARANARRLGR